MVGSGWWCGKTKEMECEKLEQGKAIGKDEYSRQSTQRLHEKMADTESGVFLG